MAAPSTITVVVPSYRRPGPLERCLDALAGQERPADQVVVAHHEGDPDTAALARSQAGRLGLPLDTAASPDRRVVPVMEAGVRAARGRVIAMTDDDAVPPPDWLARLLAGYRDERVGGVGGRDEMRDGPAAGPAASTERVGEVQWFGRVVYGHHAGAGPARDVDVLKGVNMSLRRELWRLDPALRGSGTQVHWELELCLHARREGWRLVYDPAIAVDHPRAARVDEEPRLALVPRDVADEIHNELYSILKWSRPPRRLAAIAYAFAVGQRNAPGPLLVPERLLRERKRRAVFGRARAGARGRAEAVRSWRRWARAER